MIPQDFAGYALQSRRSRRILLRQKRLRKLL
jgi:hypothetical protein